MAVNDAYTPTLLSHDSALILEDFVLMIKSVNAFKYYRGASECPWEFEYDGDSLALIPQSSKEDIKIWIAYLALILELAVKNGIEINGDGLYTFLEYQDPLSIAGAINISEKILKVTCILSKGDIQSYFIDYDGSPSLNNISITGETRIINDLDYM